MSDSPEFRKWADQAHKDSLEKPRRAKNVRYKCQACPHSTTKNQAKNNGGRCWSCKTPLPGCANKSWVQQKNPS